MTMPAHYLPDFFELSHRLTSLLPDKDQSFHMAGSSDEGKGALTNSGGQEQDILNDSQRFLSTLLSNLPGMVYRCHNDAHWTMEFVSEGCLDLTGYTAHELIESKSISFGKLVEHEDHERVVDTVQAAIKERTSFLVDYRITTRSGKQKWVREVGRGIFNNAGRLLALEGYITDITKEKIAGQRIERQLRRFESLRKIDQAISASFDLPITLQILLDQVLLHLEVDAADILLLNPTTKLLEFAQGCGFFTTVLQHTRLRLGEGYAGRAALERRIVHISRLPESLGELQRSPQIASEAFVIYFGVPLIAKGQVVGVLETFRRTPHDPDAEWLEFLEAAAGQAAIAIDNATLFNDLQNSNAELVVAYDATLEGWSKALELRDQETKGHTQRVADMTTRLAHEMGVQEKEMHHIRRGALLHDIGKMGIPDSILLKPGPLSADEWGIMRKHPGYAYQLLSPITKLRPALDIPYCHHEKWDGTGYPRGLKGKEIPLSARIFAIVDVWDALLSDRPYRPAWPVEKTLSHVRAQSGIHFDPVVVGTFLKLFDENQTHPNRSQR